MSKGKSMDVFENLKDHEQGEEMLEVKEEVREVKFEEAKEEKVETLKDLKPKAVKKVKLLIEEQEGDEHSPRVFLSVNGYPYSIRRGMVVEVPEAVIGVLDNAIVTKMFQNVDTGEITYKDVSRFNYKIVG
jgi:hypothetical protein